jgi:beta-mannosidase
VDLENPTWSHRGAWWVKRPMWDAIFGELKHLESFVHVTQFLQADGLRYALEADRRRQYHNSGTLPWQFNEPYPMAACTSAVDYYTRPKPAYYAVARAYAPLLISARFDTLTWDGCEHFEAEAWVSNSHERAYKDHTIRMRLLGMDGTPYAEHLEKVSFAANCSSRLGMLRGKLKRIPEDVFFLDLQLLDQDDILLSQNRYTFTRTSNLAPLLSCSSTTLSVSSMRSNADECTLTLMNTGSTAAMFVWLEDDRPVKAKGDIYFEDNFFCLLPGEQRIIAITWKDVPVDEQRLEISGWNIESSYLDL